MASEVKQLTCEERVQAHLDSRLADLRAMLEPTRDMITLDRKRGIVELGEVYLTIQAHDIKTFYETKGENDVHEEEAIEELIDTYWDDLREAARDRFYEYGLSFDYVAPHTFLDQAEGYFRYQLSYGGPSDEFRFYVNYGPRGGVIPHRIEYWFLDWFDGASRRLHGADYRLLADILEEFSETGTCEAEYEKAMEDYEPPHEEEKEAEEEEENDDE